MDQQEIFDKAAEHLFRQKRPARNTQGDCMYRAPDGTMCAVGCHIPDELYKSEMEAKTVGRLVRDGFALPDWFNGNFALLESLQNAHDFCSILDTGDFDVKDLWYRLAGVARQYGLKFIPPAWTGLPAPPHGIGENFP